MALMVPWFARVSCVGGLVLGFAGCDRPTGVVISVHGASDALDLWLTVGGDANADKTRFFQRSDESGLVKSQAGLTSDTTFVDGFEIYLDSAELRAQGEVALVLDSILEGTPPEIRRDSYMVTPDSDALVEVKLAPVELGPGQWICAGQAASSAAPGFIVSRDERDADCDRDGWDFREDSDDTDPLDAPSPMWVPASPSSQDCRVMLGTRTLLNVPSCALCWDPQGGFEPCLSMLPQVSCTIGTRTGTLTVAQIATPLPVNPDWELIKLGPLNAEAYFAPSIKAPDEWSVIFQLGEQLNVGWFQLNDRAAGGVSRLVRVDYEGGDASGCED
jgi:hypothetical protein